MSLSSFFACAEFTFALEIFTQELRSVYFHKNFDKAELDLAAM